jgi:uncharacterized membrane protein YfcA
MLQSGIMSTAKASFWSFLTAFKDCWLVSMTGGVLAVGFTGASLLVSQDRQRFLFEAIAVLSGIVAAYGVWSSERKARCKAEDKVNQFTSIPLATQKVYVANANLALARTVAVSVVSDRQRSKTTSGRDELFCSYRGLGECALVRLLE